MEIIIGFLIVFVVLSIVIKYKKQDGSSEEIEFQPQNQEIDLIDKWKEKDFYQTFISNTKNSIENHIKEIIEKDIYFDEKEEKEDVLCIDITERYFSIRTVSNRYKYFEYSFNLDKSKVLFGFSFFENGYSNIDLKMTKGLMDAIL